jgi:hypothetical protein
MSEQSDGSAAKEEKRDGAGARTDLGSGFVEAIVAEVRRQESSKANAQVGAALRLGWYLGALAHPADLDRGPAAIRGAGTGLGALTEGQLVDFCHSHASVAFGKLREVVESGTSLPDSEMETLRACIDSAQDDARRDAARAAHSKALSVLSAADFRLGKAYGIGAALIDLTTRPTGKIALREHLSAARIAPVVAAIDDVSSALSPHAGHGVRESLREWQKSVEQGSEVAPDNDETWQLLARQAELWRSVLAGEKVGADLLEIDDYIDAADRLSSRMRGMALRLVRTFPEASVAVLVLFVGGVLLVALTDSAAAIAAGAGTILASLGLSWRAVGRSVGSLAGKLEQPLWGAELDIAITRAITLLRREEGRDASRERRETAAELAEVASSPAPSPPARR